MNNVEVYVEKVYVENDNGTTTVMVYSDNSLVGYLTEYFYNYSDALSYATACKKEYNGKLYV